MEPSEIQQEGIDCAPEQSLRADRKGSPGFAEEDLSSVVPMVAVGLGRKTAALVVVMVVAAIAGVGKGGLPAVEGPAMWPGCTGPLH